MLKPKCEKCGDERFATARVAVDPNVALVGCYKCGHVVGVVDLAVREFLRQIRDAGYVSTHDQPPGDEREIV